MFELNPAFPAIPAAINTDLLEEYVTYSANKYSFNSLVRKMGDWYDWVYSSHIVSPVNENIINSFMSACLNCESYTDEDDEDDEDDGDEDDGDE